MQTQFAASYPHFDKQVSFNAGTYTLVRCITVCGLCAGSACAARAAAGHFLLPIAAKESKSAFRLPKQKALISAKQVFSHTPSDGSLKVLFYHLQTANAFFTYEFFSLAVG